MSKLTFKDGKLVHEYDDTDPMKATVEKQQALTIDINTSKEAAKKLLKEKGFQNLSTNEKDSLLLLLLKMHNLF